MKNFKKVFKKITPSNSEKEKMYHSITNSRGNNYYFSKVFACSIIIFVTLIFNFMSVSEDVTTNFNGRTMLMNETYEINYNGVCYTENYIDYTVGDYIGELNLENIKYDIYENIDNKKSIILYNDTYKVFVECED